MRVPPSKTKISAAVDVESDTAGQFTSMNCEFNRKMHTHAVNQIAYVYIHAI